MSVQDIRKELENLGSSAEAKNLMRFFKTGPGEYGEGDLFRGIRVPVIRKLVKKYKNTTLQSAEELLSSPFHEDRLFALLMLVDKYQNAADDKSRRAIYTLYINNMRFINNWDLVDLSAHHVAGAYLRNRSKSPLTRLAKSKILWERRIAVISTYHYIKNGEFGETLRIADILLSDTEDLIHKAVGWMLREVGNRDLSVEEEYLKPRYNIMPRTMLRYAIEKFPAQKRKAYLKGMV